MRWAALGLGIALATSALAWALVTTGHWPLDDRGGAAAAVYALNGALGRWLLDHGGEGPAAAGGPGQPGAPAPVAFTAAELEEAQRTLRTDPKFRGRYRFTPVPAATSGRG